MPIIKKLSVTFDIPIAQLLGVLASRNSSVKVDAVLNSEKTNGHRVTAKGVLLQTLAKGGAIPLDQLKAVTKHAGFSHPNTASTQLYLLRRDGLVKRHGHGQYQITDKGKKNIPGSQGNKVNFTKLGTA